MISALALSAVVAFPPPSGDFAPLSRREQAALEALQKLGFKGYGYADIGVPPSSRIIYRPDAKAKRPPVLSVTDLAPLATLKRTEVLVLDGAPVGNDAMSVVAQLPALKEVHLSSTKVTDEGLKKLRGLKQLTRVAVEHTAVTDAGVRALAALTRLQILQAKGTKLTDAGLKSLAAFPALTTLSVGANPALTGRGFAAFKGNASLVALDLAGANFGDVSAEYLRNFSNLHSVYLGDTRLTDKGLAALARPGALLKLRFLNLVGTAITDAGLKALYDPEALPAMVGLCLQSTRVTVEGAASLKKARPGIFPFR